MSFNFAKFLSALRADLQPVAVAVAAVEGLASHAPGEDKKQDALNLLGSGLSITASINQGAADKAAGVVQASAPLVEDIVALFHNLGLFQHKKAQPPVTAQLPIGVKAPIGVKTPPPVISGVGH
jgi:hypothetical protein